MSRASNTTNRTGPVSLSFYFSQVSQSAQSGWLPLPSSMLFPFCFVHQLIDLPFVEYVPTFPL